MFGVVDIGLYDFGLGDVICRHAAWPERLDYVYWLDRLETARSWDLVALAGGTYLLTAPAVDGSGSKRSWRVIVTLLTVAVMLVALRSVVSPVESTWLAMPLFVLAVELALRACLSDRRRPAVRGVLALYGALLFGVVAGLCPTPSRWHRWWQLRPPEIPVPEVWSVLLAAIALHQLFAWRARRLERELQRPTGF